MYMYSTRTTETLKCWDELVRL